MISDSRRNKTGNFYSRLLTEVVKNIMFDYFKKYNVFELSAFSYKIAPLSSVLLTITKFIEALFPSISVLLIGGFIDSAGNIFNGTAPYSSIYLSIGLLIAFLGFSFLFGILQGFINSKMSIKVNDVVTKHNLCFKASLLYRYYENKEQYVLVQRVTGAMIGNIQSSFNVLLSIVSFFIQFFSIAAIFIANNIWQAGLIIIVSTIPLSYLSYRNSIRQYKVQKENYTGEMQLYHSTYILKDRSTVNERTLFQYTDVINNKWLNMQNKLDDKMLEANNRILSVRLLTKSINLLIAFIIIFTVLYCAVKQLISIGILIALVSNILSLITGLVGSFIGLVDQIAQQKEFLKELKEVSTFETSAEFTQLPSQNFSPFESLEFRDVSFIYPSAETEVIKNVSFRIEKNKKYAFVGKNGSGKTTLIKLLTKLYSDYTGDIFINNKNLKDIPINDLQTMLGVCFQDYSHYELSFRDNIDIGDIIHYDNGELLNNKRKKIIQKLELQKILQHLPNGEETYLGKIEPNAQDLSSGEWQRLSIARLLMKNTDLYILDEPTASLDPKCEYDIYRLFNEISQDKTVILISHRLGSVKDSDIIFVMDNGELIEQGTHEELIQLSGTYANMFKNQSEWYD